MNHHTIHQGLEGMMNIDAFERRYKQTLLLCEAVELLSPYQLPKNVYYSVTAYLLNSLYQRISAFGFYGCVS